MGTLYCGIGFYKPPSGLVRRKAVGERRCVSGMPYWDLGGITRPQVVLIWLVTSLSRLSPTSKHWLGAHASVQAAG